MKKKNYLTLLALVFAMFSATWASAQCQDTTIYLQTRPKCEGRCITFNSHQICSPGTYIDTLPRVYGCDSFIVLTVVDIPSSRVDFYDTICQGASVNFNGRTLTAAGNYIDTFYSVSTAPFYCDSLVTFHLTVNPSHNDTIHLSGSGCVVRTGGGPGGGTFSGGYIFYGDTLKASGNYAHHKAGVAICSDTVYYLALTIGQSTTVNQNVGICTNSSYTIHGHTYTTAGTYRDTLTSHIGCDSIVVTRLTISAYIQPNATAATFCAGGSYTWRGHTYTTASPGGPFGGGGYKDTVAGTAGACDTIFTLNLTQSNSIRVFPPSQGTICTGGTYTWRGHTYTQPATGGGPFAGYGDTVPAPGGCDSIFTLILTQGTNPRAVRTDSFCYGSSYLFHGQIYTTSGNDTVYGTTAGNGGCDTMYILRLSYKAAPGITLRDSFCQGSTFTYGTYSFTTSGTYRVGSLSSPTGCDTVIYLTLAYKAAPSYTYIDSFCQGGSFTYKGNTFTTTGNHVVTVASPSGCDTVITVRLTYKSAPARTVNATICTGGLYIYGQDTLTAQGNYTVLVPSPTGCDSIISLRLRTANNPRAFVTDSFCAGTTFHYRTDSFTTAGRHTLTVPSRTGGCDTNITLNLTIKQAISVNPITITGSTLVANASGTGLSYQWYLNGAIINGATSQFYSPITQGSYSVEVSNGIGCPGLSGGYNYLSGINDVSSDLFKLYPNPNTGKFTVETQNYSGTELTIYDVFGRLVFQKSLSSSKELIDLSSTTNGTYYLVMKNQQYTKYAHFVIAQ